MFKILLKNIPFIGVLFTLLSSSNAYAASNRPYTTADWEKIAIIVVIAVLIFSPSKFRVIVIGTTLGLTCAYLTYKYLLPILQNF
ncbi:MULTISPECIES: DUF5510 family protein [unclassified Rickettsia]|uniref:DUF5510 family protein n=1 Tax=unclassified Rickettsia TaxID=114295 RepID=UPI0020A1533A|nr:DUF5510 family protein [Rickettsia endosymbiont of Ceutorhynchus assimilis]